MFADDIEHMVKSSDGDYGGPSTSSDSRSRKPTSRVEAHTAPYSSASQSTSVTQKRKAARSLSPLSENDIQVIEASTDDHASTSRGSIGRARKVPRRTLGQNESDDEFDQFRDDAPGTSGRNTYKLTIPTTLPEHPPSSPTKLVPCARGFVFTDEDIAYFVSLVLWQAKINPGASKRSIITALTAGVRVHLVASIAPRPDSNHERPVITLMRPGTHFGAASKAKIS